MELRDRQAQRDSWEWLAFAASLPSRPIPFVGVSGNTLVYSGRCILTGVTANNTNAASGVIQLLDGLDATGVPAWQVHAGGTNQVQSILPNNGVLMDIGVFMEVSSATITGSVLLIPLAHYDMTQPGH